jgi:hypothetical protein
VEVGERLVAAGRRGDRRACLLVLEVHDLDGLARGKDDAADVVAGIVRAHRREEMGALTDR